MTLVDRKWTGIPGRVGYTVLYLSYLFCTFVGGLLGLRPFDLECGR